MSHPMRWIGVFLLCLLAFSLAGCNRYVIWEPRLVPEPENAEASTLVPVCPACHHYVDFDSSFCRHCHRYVIWTEDPSETKK